MQALCSCLFSCKGRLIYYLYIQGLIICGVDCLMSAEWKSNNKIVARSGGGIGKGDIIVVTTQGGRGTSTVQFKGNK